MESRFSLKCTMLKHPPTLAIRDGTLGFWAAKGEAKAGLRE